MAAAFRALAVCALCVPSFVDCGDDFSGHAHPSEGVVPRSVVDDQSEEWRQRPRSAARVGARQLPNGVVLAAQTEAGDGASGRSEEHTSELQSLTNLVCRLLLEK